METVVVSIPSAHHCYAVSRPRLALDDDALRISVSASAPASAPASASASASASSFAAAAETFGPGGDAEVVGRPVEFVAGRGEVDAYVADVDDASETRSTMGSILDSLDGADAHGQQAISAAEELQHMPRGAMRATGGRPFVAYLLDIRLLSFCDVRRAVVLRRRWRCLKRYSSLRAFWQAERLPGASRLGALLSLAGRGPFPPKAYVCPADVGARRQQLEDCLRGLLRDPSLLQRESVQAFLRSSDADMVNLCEAARAQPPAPSRGLSRKHSGSDSDRSDALSQVLRHSDYASSCESDGPRRRRRRRKKAARRGSRASSASNASSSRTPVRRHSSFVRAEMSDAAVAEELKRRLREALSEGEVRSLRARFLGAVTRGDETITKAQLCDLCGWDAGDPMVSHYLKEFEVDDYDTIDFARFASIMAVALKRSRRRSSVRLMTASGKQAAASAAEEALALQAAKLALRDSSGSEGDGEGRAKRLLAPSFRRLSHVAGAGEGVGEGAGEADAEKADAEKAAEAVRMDGAGGEGGAAATVLRGSKVAA